MSDALASLAMLCGVLLIAAGVVLALVTGFDPLFLIGAAVVIGLGVLLLVKFRGKLDTTAHQSEGSSHRSVQKPEAQSKSERPKLDKL